MTSEILLLSLTLVAAIVFFSIEMISAEVIGLGVLVVLLLTGLLEPAEAFAGFGSEAVILILGLLIMTAGLTRTGVVDVVGRFILRRTGENANRLVLWV
ncbi:MAG TPA: SLC13 family permease, partial [Anaerolineaceae bacterium]|nr:SLC13 family permease [Anaerolineaceae bacterium]